MRRSSGRPLAVSFRQGSGHPADRPQVVFRSHQRCVPADGHSANLMVGNVTDGMWMRNSAMDNPQFLATTMANFLGWKNAKPDRSYAEARPLSIDKGQFLFQSRCQACHTVGEGDKLGPDLMGVTQRRERGWLTSYLAQPEKMLAEGDPIATSLFKKYKQVRMPNLDLGTERRRRAATYLEGRSPPQRARTDASL